MKTKMANILIAVQAVAGLVLIGAVKLWAPVCGKMLELANGNSVPMKCHWAGQAALVVSVLIVVTAVMGLLAKKDYKKFAVVNAVAAVLLFMVFTSLIGVCASEEMRCQITALWGKGVAAVTLVTSLALLLGGKEGQIPD
ncbi:MAG: DUF4418 family protein [Oscillospiraceae bacterium]|nr:DUF4418 family protein [Oscillospiraceae bacterium]MBR2928456.1 DUF4418 family protein [Oscillospiraceae bacterium]